MVHWDFSSQVQNFVLTKISKTETLERLLLPRLPVSRGVCELKFHQSEQQPHLPVLYLLKIYWVDSVSLSELLMKKPKSVFITVRLYSFPNINWTSSYWLCSLSLGFWTTQPTYSPFNKPILHHVISDNAFEMCQKPNYSKTPLHSLPSLHLHAQSFCHSGQPGWSSMICSW